MAARAGVDVRHATQPDAERRQQRGSVASPSDVDVSRMNQAPSVRAVTGGVGVASADGDTVPALPSGLDDVVQDRRCGDGRARTGAAEEQFARPERGERDRVLHAVDPAERVGSLDVGRAGVRGHRRLAPVGEHDRTNRASEGRGVLLVAPVDAGDAGLVDLRGMHVEPARCRSSTHSFSTASSPSTSFDGSGSAKPARWALASASAKLTPSRAMRDSTKLLVPLRMPRKRRDRARKRTAAERAEERHTGEHAGLVEQRNARGGGRGEELGAAVGEQRLVRGHHRDAGVQRFEDQRSCRLDARRALRSATSGFEASAVPGSVVSGSAAVSIARGLAAGRGRVPRRCAKAAGNAPDARAASAATAPPTWPRPRMATRISRTGAESMVVRCARGAWATIVMSSHRAHSDRPHGWRCGANRTPQIWELERNCRDQTVYRGSYLSRFIGQEVAPGHSRKGLVAVASSGLFPQPLWISVRSEGEPHRAYGTAGGLSMSGLCSGLGTRGLGTRDSATGWELAIDHHCRAPRLEFSRRHRFHWFSRLVRRPRWFFATASAAARVPASRPRPASTAGRWPTVCCRRSGWRSRCGGGRQSGWCCAMRARAYLAWLAVRSLARRACLRARGRSSGCRAGAPRAAQQHLRRLPHEPAEPGDRDVLPGRRAAVRAAGAPLARSVLLLMTVHVAMALTWHLVWAAAAARSPER